MGVIIIRFLIGGLAVSIFAVIGDVTKPKSFSGLFAAAPSVALASLGLALAKHGPPYASTEGRSMIMGAVGLGIYTGVVACLVKGLKWKALPAASLTMFAWFAVAFGIFAIAGST